MGYTALYRKFRPQVFDDVKGQDHIVTTLKNQIRANRLGHAYLFCGTRGTGKTTVAKILARAVNCENPQDGSPCGECSVCKAIASGSSLNVVEIDAASNNGVENIRTIIEEVSYRPTEGRYKVYIMDEVHMLSEGARNALLKTLEEPPEYVIFILATTEVPRIPITIMSRCQRYDFKRISIDTIAARMKELTDSEGIEVEDKALRYVAKAADGSMRDGLSLLDQCIAFHFGEVLTYDKVLEILGAVDTEIFSSLFRLLLEENIIGAIELLEDVVMQGRDLSQFVMDFIWYLRNLMLLKSVESEDMEEFLNVSPEHLTALREDAASAELNMLIRWIEVFSELQVRMRGAVQKRILVEMYLIRLMRPQMDTDQKSVLERIRRIEKKLEDGSFIAASVQKQPQNTDSKPKEIQPEKKVTDINSVSADIKQIVADWKIIVGKTAYLTRRWLEMAIVEEGPQGQLLIEISDRNIDLTNRPEFRQEIAKTFMEHYGREVDFEVLMYPAEQEEDKRQNDLKELLPGIPIEEED